MRFTSETTSNGVSERLFTLADIPGVLWSPADAAGHGDRPKTEPDERFAAGIRERIAAGASIGPQIAHDNAERAARAVPEWQATLDALQELDCVGAGGPVGFWGVSMGSGLGVPFAAAEPRITAAVFGLAGGETLAEANVLFCRRAFVVGVRCQPWFGDAGPRLDSRRGCGSNAG